MDSQHLPFAGASFLLRPFEDQTFQSHSPSLADDGILEPSLGYFHPDFQVSSPSTDSTNPHWEPAQRVQQYLNDDQLRTLFHAETSSIISTQRPTSRVVGILPVPATSHPGFASPLSSIDPWTGTGSALSPAADTESCHDSYPRTPPDTALKSPFSHPAQFEWAQAGASDLQFVSMGSESNNICVNPCDVDPGYGDSDGSSLNFDLTTQASFGLGSYSTRCELDPPQNPAVVVQPGSLLIREESPPPVEDEIEAVQYPLQAAQSGDKTDDEDEDDGDDEEDDDDGDECDASDDVAEAPVKRRMDSDDDGDYIPGKKPKAAIIAGSRRTRPKQAPINRSPKSPGKTASRAVSSGTQTALLVSPLGPAEGPFPCGHCDHASFQDESSLQNHIKKQHNQPFICVFHFAGCTAIFPSKNEWKRHVLTQHLLLQYWLCKEGACGKNVKDPKGTAPSTKHRPQGPASRSSNVGAMSGPAPPPGDKIFRRKDLFTQHLRRMHHQSQLGKTSKHRKGSSSSEADRRWADYIQARQRDCARTRCRLPQRMLCPVGQCGQEFQGPDAWDQRMEHVAKHLEKAALGEGPAVTFGGEGDSTLVEWAARPDVAVVKRGLAGSGWVLNDPLEGGIDTASGAAIDVACAHVDAEDEVVMGEIVVENSWDADMDAEGEYDD